MNLGDFTVHENLTAHFFNFGSGDFPELTRTILRVIEFFNQRGFHLAVGLIRIQLGEHILDNGSDGQALDTLRAPVCGDFSWMATPQLFGVALEEHGIQLFAETIDIEVFQRGFFFFADGALQVAASGCNGSSEAHVLDGIPLQGNRIVKELMLIINSGYPIPHQHDTVGFFRVWAAGSEFLFPMQLDVIERRLALTWHHLLPPVHNLLVFGEEPMSANVHAVVFIFYGFRDSADSIAFF